MGGHRWAPSGKPNGAQKIRSRVPFRTEIRSRRNLVPEPTTQCRGYGPRRQEQMLARDSVTNPEGQGGLLGGIIELDDREGFLSQDQHRGCQSERIKALYKEALEPRRP